MNPNFEKFKKAIAFLHKALLVLCTVLIVLGVLIIARSLINARFLSNYNKGKYPTVLESLLNYLPFGENYVAPYNLGNAAYMHGDYETAVSYYATALEKDPPEHDEECMIRVNLALALCHTIDFDNLDLSDQAAVQHAIEVLLTARNYLTEHGCASEPVGSNDGHFPDADSLKHDIDEMLKKLQQSGGGDDQSDQGGGGGEDQDDQSGGDEDQEQNQQDQQQQQQSSKSQEEKEKEERARQEDVKEQLDQQKEDLKDRSESSASYDYEYIEGGDAQGYGDGTLW